MFSSQWLKIILDDHSGLLIQIFKIQAFTFTMKIALKYKKQSSIHHKILDLSICNACSQHVHCQTEHTNGHQGPLVTNTLAPVYVHLILFLSRESSFNVKASCHGIELLHAQIQYQTDTGMLLLIIKRLPEKKQKNI